MRLIRVTTHRRSRAQEAGFEKLIAKFRELGLSIHIAYQDDLHLRGIMFSNGTVATCDRGLDIYRGPNASGVRYCREASLNFFELSCSAVAKEKDVAATLAKEAQTLVSQGVAKDIAHVKAMAREKLKSG